MKRIKYLYTIYVHLHLCVFYIDYTTDTHGNRIEDRMINRNEINNKKNERE